MIPQLHKCINYFKDKILNKVDANFWVAGGSIKDYFIYGNTDNCADIDLYFPDNNNFNKVKQYLESQGYEYHAESEYSLKMKKDNNVYDLVKIFHSDPKSTIYFFDFTICCCAVDRYGIYHHESFFIDTLQRRLVMNDIRKPLNSLSRMRKYAMRGFFMDNENLFKLVQSIRETSANQVPLNTEECFVRSPFTSETSLLDGFLFDEDCGEDIQRPIRENNHRSMEINQCNEMSSYC